MVPVTHKDLARLVKATGRAAGEIVRFCPDSEMEFDESSGLWISFGGIRRAMVLRRRAGGCMFQTKEYACSAYASRPQTCRTFPYSVYFEDEKNSAVSEIKLNKVLDCSAKRCLSVDIDTIIADVRKENREDKEYHRLVKRWNEAKKKGTGADFLKFIGF
jgi:Fe-S-cluster containining protein